MCQPALYRPEREREARLKRATVHGSVLHSCRVLYTRDAGTPLISGIPLLIYVTGACNVPLTAKAAISKEPC